MTNFEWIKSLNLEQMEEFLYLAKLDGCGRTCTNFAEIDCAYTSCSSHMNEWLLQQHNPSKWKEFKGESK